MNYIQGKISLTRVKEWGLQRRQQFIIKWLPTLDLNTRFFHLTTIVKRRRKKIEFFIFYFLFLFLNDENYISPREEIEVCFVNYFENLFKTSVHTQNIWILSLTSIWAHNLFVLWVFGFPTMGGPMLGRPKYTYISSRLFLFPTKSLPCSL